MRDWFAGHLLHFGWAFLGQECDCGHNRFNWLARLIGDGQWDDDGEPSNRLTRIKFEIGHWFVMQHNWLQH